MTISRNAGMTSLMHVMERAFCVAERLQKSLGTVYIILTVIDTSFSTSL